MAATAPSTSSASTKVSKTPDSFTFTVGKLDAGMAILIGERAHLIEFPSLLLPPGAGSGSIVNISVHRNTAEEERQRAEFWQLQNEIYKAFGVASPRSPRLELRNVTQTSVTLEWPALELATARLRSLDIYKNGQRLAAIPSPLQNTSTKLSGLELNTEYTFQLLLRTTAGTYPSNTIRVRTHTITDTSGISVCFGTVEDAALLEHAKRALRDMHARASDKIQIDTTHFVCTTPGATPNGSQASGSVASAPGVEYQRALQLSIPIVQPQWVLACHAEKKMVPISNYYLGTTPAASTSPTQFARPKSWQHPSGRPEPPPLNYHASLPPSSPSPPSLILPASSFINQSETDADAADDITSAKVRPRNGTMRKDFKFPPLASAAPPVPSSQGNAEPVPPKDVVPQVPPPPPVEKEQVPAQTQVHDDDVEDEVGPTVEVDLS